MSRSWITWSLLVICFVFVVWMSFYKLTETPPTWMDEGIITQISRNMALNGEYGLQVAPNSFISGGFITTSYPVLVPVSLSFSIFGVGIFQARVIMALFIIGLFISVYIFFRKRYKGREWFLVGALALLSTFAPLYGQGKNVLGEVPGLFYLMIGLIFLQKIYEQKARTFEYVIAGCFFGLAIVTKPIYILIAPALLLTLILYRTKMQLTTKPYVFFYIALFIPVAIWLLVQFGGESWNTVAQLYSNPNASSDIIAVIIQNIKRFFTEAQPFYTLILFAAWSTGMIWRYRQKKSIYPSELIAYTFSLLVLLAYVRTAGFYRYFFEAEVLALVFFTYSLKDMISHKYSKLLALTIILLISFQIYQLFTHSWVATYGQSKRSAMLKEYIGAIDPHQSILFYQSPEAVNFLRSDHANYYQFVRITEALALGESSLKVLDTHEVDRIVTSREFKDDPRFAGYLTTSEFDRYVILSKDGVE